MSRTSLHSESSYSLSLQVNHAWHYNVYHLPRNYHLPYGKLKINKKGLFFAEDKVLLTLKSLLSKMTE